MYKKPFTLWMTGLSGSGKTTIALELKKIYPNTVILDGDELRSSINKDLGFDDVSRAENVRRVSEIAKLFNDNNKNVIVSLISPFEKDRQIAKTIIGDRFYLCYLQCSLAKCQERDVKGLYKKVKNNQIQNFTGISSRYEEPLSYDIKLNTEKTNLKDCIKTIQNKLSLKQKYIVISFGHSSTSTLAASLSQHPNILNSGEILNKNYNYNSYKYSEDGLKSEKIQTLLDEFYNSETKKDCIGFNFHFPHSDFFKDSIFEYVENNNLKIISIKRNPLNVFLHGQERIIFEPKKFEYFLQYYINCYKKVFSMPNEKYLIDMEVYTKDVVRETNKIYEFLGQSYHIFTDYSGNTNSKKLQERIVNYNEVQSYINNLNLNNLF